MTARPLKSFRQPRAGALVFHHLVPVAIVVVVYGALAFGALGTTSASWVDTSANEANMFGTGDWTKWIEVDGGTEFSCAANRDGSAWCWGTNSDGQLGDSSTSQRTSPVQVVGSGGSGTLDGVVDISTGEAFTCAVLDVGSVWCWGRNDKGQLGTGNTSSATSPVQVVGVGGSGTLSDAIDVAAGQKHACAVQADGDVYCWGEGNVGQLGNGTTSNSSTPVLALSGGSGSTTPAVGSGLDHTCAVTRASGLKCWGEGSAGQIGDGATSDRSSPQTVLGVGGSGSLSDVVEVDGGTSHTCARHSDGSLTCWGDNADSQLAPSRSGDGTVIWKNNGDNSPDQAVYNSSSGLDASANMQGVGDWRIIQGAASADGSEAIVLGVDSSNQIDGQMWTGSAWSALPFNSLATVSDSFWWGFDVAYESQSGDAVIVWNNGTSGTAGLSYRVWNGSAWSSTSTITTPLAGEPNQMQLASAPDTNEMVLIVSNASGNDYALVWNGSSWGNSITLHTGADNLTEVNVTYEQTSGDALVIHGKLSDEMYYRTWNGSSWSAEGSITVPAGTTTSSSSRWSTIASDPTSDRIIIGVHNQVNGGWVAIWDGSAWGNKQTVTTAGSGTNHPWMAVAFEGMSGDALVTYGESNQYVRYRTWPAGGSWGSQQSGPDMGTAEYVNSMMLYPRPGSNEIMFVGNDDDSDLELYPWDGSSWGSYMQPTTNTGEIKNQPFLFLWDFVGQTGAPPASSTSPLEVQGHNGSTWSDAVDIGLGEAHTCAVTSGGAAYCWGLNQRGELGDNSTTERSAPTRVVGSGGTGTLDSVDLIGGGYGIHTCAAVADKEELWCWGRNNRGQLGDNTVTDRLYPVYARGST